MCEANDARRAQWHADRRTRGERAAGAFGTIRNLDTGHTARTGGSSDAARAGGAECGCQNWRRRSEGSGRERKRGSARRLCGWIGAEQLLARVFSLGRERHERCRDIYKQTESDAGKTTELKENTTVSFVALPCLTKAAVQRSVNAAAELVCSDEATAVADLAPNHRA